jgi:hypothetical protein
MSELGFDAAKATSATASLERLLRRDDRYSRVP